MSDTMSKLRDLEEEEYRTFRLPLIVTHRRSNSVLRYHTVRTVVPETVGHHSANVAILCSLLTGNQPSAGLLMAALLHDRHEYFTGDVPAQAKWESPELAEALHRLEEKYDRYFLTEYLLSTEEVRILKQADMLDLCFKCLEELQMGNKEFSLILNRGLSFLRNNNPLPMTVSIIQEIEHELKSQ